MNALVKRRDGKYEQRLPNGWVAEYSEQPGNGLWRVELFRHDVPEWVAMDYESLEEAQQAATDYYTQR